MLKKRPKERLAERRHPGEAEPEYCSPGSIEQQLDMCEQGSLRGDDILFSHGLGVPEEIDGLKGVDRLMDLYEVDMAEDSREGDEMSGDEHSFGLQGGEPELRGQPHIDTGMPGDRLQREELTERSDFLEEVGEEEGIIREVKGETSHGPQTPSVSIRSALESLARGNGVIQRGKGHAWP